MHLFTYPSEHSTISTGRVGAGEVHRVGAAGGRTLADIAVVSHRHEHELVVQIVLPHKDFGLSLICCQSYVTGDAIASAEDITAVLTLEDYLTLASVYNTETCLRSVVFCICII